MIASIFPSTPLSPNPPGTKIPSTLLNMFLAFSAVTSTAFIHCILTFASLASPPWFKASTTEIYASCNSTYLPTKAIVTSFLRFFILSTISIHSLLLISMHPNCNFSTTSLSNPSLCNINGTSYKLLASKFCITFLASRLQNKPILLLKLSFNGFSDLHTIMSG